MRATVTLNGATYSYDEATGARASDHYVDALPALVNGGASRFQMSHTVVTRPDCPLRMVVRRMVGTSYWRIIFDLGDIKSGPKSLPPYTVDLNGQTIKVRGHWSFGRWSQTSGRWPFPFTPVADLVAAKLVPPYDLNAFKGTPPATEKVPSYSPMVITFDPTMENTGERNDIGPVTDWQARYLCTHDAGALADVMNGAEGGWTFPFYYFDPSTGRTIDAIVQHPEAAIGPTFQFCPAGSTVDMIISGPPNTALPAGMYVVDSGTGTYYIYNGRAGSTMPANGSLRVTVWTVGAQRVAPTGTASIHLAGGQTPIPGVSVAFVPNSAVPGTGIVLESGHMPAIFYLPFLLTGDPYYLEGLHGQVMFTAMEVARRQGPPPTPPAINFGNGQPRGLAWSLRDLMGAAKVTPAITPSWMLPQSVFRKGLDNWRAYLTTRWINATTDPMRSGGLFMPNLYPTMIITPWQHHFITLIAAWTAMLHPEWMPLARYCAAEAIAEANGTSGWCRAAPTPFVLQIRDTPDAPVYPNWAKVWQVNAPLLAKSDPRLIVNGAPFCPTDMLLNRGGAFDYPNNHLAALTMVERAGISTEGGRAWLYGQLAPKLAAGAGQIEYKWRIAI